MRYHSPHKTLIDPIFAIPPGAEDEFIYSDNQPDLDYLESVVGSTDAPIDISEYIEEDYETDNNTLEVPDEFYVAQQILNRAPGGQQTVDVVVVVEDIFGATNFEAKVTKLGNVV